MTEHTLFRGAGRIGFAGGSVVRSLIAANGFVDLITMDRHFLGCFHTKADLIAADFHHDDRNVIIDDDAFVLFP
jgi:hypothetical protein